MRALSLLISRRPWVVLLVWLAVVLLSAYPASLAPARLSASPGEVKESESARVIQILREQFGEKENNMVLLVTESTPNLGTPEGQRVYNQFTEGLAEVKGVSSVLAGGERGGVSTISEDKRHTITIAQIPIKDGATEALAAVRAYVRQFEGQWGRKLSVKVTGGQAIADDFTRLAEVDTKRSEFSALPLIALVLLGVFGALVATGLPLIVGLLSITVSMAGLYGLTQLIEVSTFAQSVITMIGLGAGIDYALLMVNRFREELAKGQTAPNAAAQTVLTAGRSVIFSGLTVAVAMAAMILPPIAYVRSLGIGGVLVVLLTVLASITALPALLALLGERINSPRIAWLTRFQQAEASAGWIAFSRKVIGRPWLAVIGSTLLLLTLALPARDMRTGYAGAWGLTAGVESRDALAQVRDLGAGGLLSQFEVVLDLQGQRYGPQQRQQFQQVVNDLRDMPGVRFVLSPFLTPEDLKGAGASGNDAIAALSALTQRSFSKNRDYLRLTVIPENYLRADQIEPFERQIRQRIEARGLRYLLGGSPVGEREFSHQITGALPSAIAIVFIGTFLLLLVAFRSILIPIKSIAMNALTVAAGYGIVTLVVQKGVGAQYLGIPMDTGVLDSSLPIMLFAVMFGLSMDYEIFLLSRVQEEYLRGHSNDESVVLAVGHTARIITSAAIIMFIVFAAFVIGRVVASKSIGIGLAASVFLDATIVRMILVPAFLKLAGQWNWWLPAWLDKRLPHIHIEH